MSPLVLAVLLAAAPAASPIDCTVNGAPFTPVKVTSGVVRNEQLMGPGRWLTVQLEDADKAVIGLVASWDKLEAGKMEAAGTAVEGASAPFQATWSGPRHGPPHVPGKWSAKVEKLD